MRINRLTGILLGALLFFTFYPSSFTFMNAYAASKGKGPVAYWQFNEGGGGSAYDQGWADADSDGIKDTGEAWSNNTGTLTPGAGGSNLNAGQMWTRQGKISGALELDGADDYVAISGVGVNTNGGAKNTVSFWMYWNGAGGGMPISFASSCYNLYFDGNNLGFNNCSSNNWGISVANYANQWVHVAAIFNNGLLSGSELYINGVKQTLSWTIGSDSSSTLSSGVYIGKYYGGGYNFGGKIDDLKIYNYARTADQILVDYNAGMAVHSGTGTDPNEGNPPVAYWKLDENTGTTAYDRSGNGNNGTLTNGPTWAAGKYGLAVNFDGTDDYISMGTIGSGSILNPSTNDWTYSLWVKRNPTPNYHIILATGPFNGTDDRMGIYSSGSGVFIDNADGTNRDTVTFTGFTDSVWQHLAMTVDRDGQTIAYLNGVRVDSKATTVSNDITPNYALLIARTISLGSYAYMNGTIDDVKIYNYARTQAQIAYDYNKGKPVAQYKFDEGGGTIAHNEYSSADTGAAPVGWWRMDNNWNDASGNGLNGTANGGATFLSLAKIGPYTGSFDGTDDYVSVSNSPVYQYTNNTFTWEAWVKLDTDAATAQNNGILKQTGNGTNIGLRIYGGNAFDFSSYGRNASYWDHMSGTTVPTQNTWYYIALTYDGSIKKIFVNGVLENTQTPTFPVLSNNTGDLWIGKQWDGNSEWDGLIDDVRIYNYARTAEQIYNDYKTTHGTLVGDTKFVDGKIGKALQFDGADDYVAVPSISFTSTLTISAWVNLSSGGDSYATFVQEGDYDSNANINLGASTISPTDVTFYMQHGNDTSTATYLFPNAYNKWIHVIGVFDTNRSKLYINGTYVSQGNTTTFSAPSGVLYLGANHEDRLNTQDTKGLIDDVRIYNYSRTADQVLQDYNAGMSINSGTSTGVADPWGGALPVGHWKLDENTGVLANDASGNSNTGTWYGAGSHWAAGKYGIAGNFNGNGDYIEKTSASSLSTGNSARTVSAWIKAKSGNTAADYQTIFNWGTLTTGQRFGVLVTTAGKPYFVGQSADFIGNATINNDTWQHVTVTYDSTTVKLYINGILDSSGTPSLNTTGTNLRIGRRLTGDASTEYFNGLIDDVRIYNYARTQAQIAWDYNKGKPVGYWRFDESSGTTCYDDSGNNNGTATIGGTGTQTTIAAARTNGATGKYGKCMSFDGTDDYVSVADSNILDFSTKDFTAEGWFYVTSAALVTNTEYGLINKNSNFQSSAGWGIEMSTWGKTSPFSDVNVSGYNTGQTTWGNTGVGGTIATNAWHHIALLRSGSSLNFYIDGESVSTNSHANVALSVDNAQSVIIGDHSWGPNFPGKIDDVRIYNYARTVDQILQDYNQGLASKLGE